MKITDLKRGQMFRTGRQKKFRQFLQCDLLTDDEIGKELQGKLVVYYDNCKEMFCDPDTVVEVSEDFYMPVKGYGRSYSTGKQKIEIDINGVRTKISHFLKDGNRMLYVYSIQNKEGAFVDLDVRSINGFPEIHFETMMKDGLSILTDHIKANQASYMHLL